MKNYWILFTFLILVIATSCRDDFETVPSTGELRFSKDTVYLDTVFTNIGSSTYNLKVYNNSNNDIYIPTIKLDRGQNSGYRLNVDGVAGKSFENVEILAKDSLYIFIETTIDYNAITDPLYTDKILFDNGNNQQDVDLVTLVQDAVFIMPNQNPITHEIDVLTLDGNQTSIQGRFLNDNELTFTNEKPYIIYGYAAVASNKTLTVDAGAKIHFHANSGLIIDPNATLNINGTLTDEVIIEGDRLEPDFDDIAGQWGIIWLRAGSVNNTINYTTIKNGTLGILTDSIANNTTPTLAIKNSKIYNHSTYGILGRKTNILGENLVIGNAGLSSIACTRGGIYNFTHATFANYWNNNNGLRQFPTVLVNNFFSYINNNGTEIVETFDLIETNFTNCIIFGSNNVELILDNVTGSTFNYNFKNNLIRFDDFNDNFADFPEYDFTDTAHFQNNILNQSPDFKNTSTNDFIIGEDAAGNNQASQIEANQIPLDILGVDRTTNPDVGAYQHIIFE